MRITIPRKLETLLIVLMLAPAGMLFATVQSPTALQEANPAKWASQQHATQLINKIQDLAYSVSKKVGPLQVNEMNTPWPAQATMLDQLKTRVNQMSEDLFQLSAMRKSLAPWQQKLLHLMTPKVHELVYQTRAAIKEMNARQSAMALAMTPYQQNIDIIGRQSVKLQNSVGVFTHYQHAKAKLAQLQRHPSPAAS